MPIYEYRCSACACEFEELIRNGSDEQALRCPSCRGAEVKRQLSVFGMRSTSRASSGTSHSCASCSGKSCGTCR